MIKALSLGICISLSFASIAYSQEPMVAEEPSSQEQLLNLEAQNRKNYNDAVNNELYRSEDSDLKELVRNANALNKKDNPAAQDVEVNVDNKDQMRKFINKHLGVAEVGKTQSK